MGDAPAAPYGELDWDFRDPGMGMVHEEVVWGELRFDRRDLKERELAELVLYLRFIAQGYARYSGRHAVMEDRARTFWIPCPWAWPRRTSKGCCWISTSS